MRAVNLVVSTLNDLALTSVPQFNFPVKHIFARRENKLMDLIVTIDSYLAKLKEIEATKPPQKRLSVPTQTDFARLLGVTPGSLSKIFANRIDGLSRKKLATIIAELRRRGFNTDVNDILVYTED